MPFRACQSNDLKCPWFDVANIEANGQETDAIILETRSIEPIEKHARKARFAAVTKKSYKSLTPAKPSNPDT